MALGSRIESSYKNNPMKTKSLSFACLAGCIALLSLSCTSEDKDKDKVKTFAEEFASAVSKGDSAAISKMYPGAVSADSLTFDFIADSVVISTDDAQHLTTLSFPNGVDLVLSEEGEGQYVIQSSHGIFAYPSDVLSFAKKTGQWKEGLSDVEQAARMADQGLVDYLYEQFTAQLKNGLSIIKTGTYGDDYYEGEWVSSKGATFTIKNNSSIDIPGSAYQVIYKEGYWGGGSMVTETVPGQDVSAGGTVTLRTSKLGSSMESDVSQRLEVKGISKEDFLKDFHPKGNEFEEYQKRGSTPAPVVTKGESMEFVVEGLMGNWATRLLMYGKSGSLMYTPNSKDLGNGDNEQRNVDLVSYDPSSGRLVLRVSRFDGTVTGNLVGTYLNGQYKGQFKNVNGKSSSFSFK